MPPLSACLQCVTPRAGDANLACMHNARSPRAAHNRSLTTAARAPARRQPSFWEVQAMRITIIGAGFSGSTLATLLATTRDDAHEVCLVGVAETFGRGVAYGETRPEHLLNVRARGLGADPDDPAEFADWLQLDEHARDSFLPRQAYGEYLHDRLRRAQADSSNLTCIEEEAIALERVA